MSVINQYPKPETGPPDKGTRKRCRDCLESVIGEGHKKRRTAKIKYLSLEMSIIAFYVEMI